VGIKKYKPTTPSLRFRSVVTNEDITRREPEKSLVVKHSSSGGRNNGGRITVRHRGGGHKRRMRRVDFKREKDGIAAKVAHIEYDPNRSARLALLHYVDGEKRYILCPSGVYVGDQLMSGPQAEIRPGNALSLAQIPSGTDVHAIELYPGAGASFVRSAGTAATFMGREGKYAFIRLPSGEMRMVLSTCKATVGQVGNSDHANISLGKAGSTRRLGRRPKVRGVAMNPVDHPMGGGEGRSSGGRHPSTPWGKKTKGLRTRQRNKASDRLITRRRSSR